jgi:hypothetical protein
MDEERRLRERLAQINGMDPNGKAWVRWCHEIGIEGMKRAITRCEQGRGGIRVKPFSDATADNTHGTARPAPPECRAAG